jgi:hypothetical protein
LQLLPPTPLDDLAARIQAEHRGVIASVKRGLQHAMAAGDLLIQAKALVAKTRCVFQRRQLSTRPTGRLDHARQCQLQVRRVYDARIVTEPRPRPEAPMYLPRGFSSASEITAPLGLARPGFFVASPTH